MADQETLRPRIYISGPMSKLPDLNFPAFHAEAARLRALGHEVVNPAELQQGPNPTWKSCLRRCLRVMLDCDVVALLPGWEDSDGAHLELHVASRVGLVVMRASEITE